MKNKIIYINMLLNSIAIKINMKNIKNLRYMIHKNNNSPF